jgi:hypothetical protein
MRNLFVSGQDDDDDANRMIADDTRAHILHYLTDPYTHAGPHPL